MGGARGRTASGPSPGPADVGRAGAVAHQGRHTELASAHDGRANGEGVRLSSRRRVPQVRVASRGGQRPHWFCAGCSLNRRTRARVGRARVGRVGTACVPSEPVTVDQPIRVVAHKLGLNAVHPDGKPAQTKFERISFNGVSSTVRCTCAPEPGCASDERTHGTDPFAPLTGAIASPPPPSPPCGAARLQRFPGNGPHAPDPRPSAMAGCVLRASARPALTLTQS